MKDKIISYFGIDKHGSTIRREILAGFTTFISMAYILFVNPTVLGAAHMDKGAVFTATALASAFGCLMMGLYAKYPIATAPGLGVNAFLCLFSCYRNGYSLANSIGWCIRRSYYFLINYSI